ncbi:MAG TPA: hypothetical protein PKH77_13915 [Anaerolineae bacterium]|nr:hypothetical protein [Anaerolineae bacterium]
MNVEDKMVPPENIAGLDRPTRLELWWCAKCYPYPLERQHRNAELAQLLQSPQGEIWYMLVFEGDLPAVLRPFLAQGGFRSRVNGGFAEYYLSETQRLAILDGLELARQRPENQVYFVENAVEHLRRLTREQKDSTLTFPWLKPLRERLRRYLLLCPEPGEYLHEDPAVLNREAAELHSVIEFTPSGIYIRPYPIVDLSASLQLPTLPNWRALDYWDMMDAARKRPDEEVLMSAISHLCYLQKLELSLTAGQLRDYIARHPSLARRKDMPPAYLSAMRHFFGLGPQDVLPDYPEVLTELSSYTFKILRGLMNRYLKGEIDLLDYNDLRAEMISDGLLPSQKLPISDDRLGREQVLLRGLTPVDVQALHSILSAKTRKA